MVPRVATAHPRKHSIPPRNRDGRESARKVESTLCEAAPLTTSTQRSRGSRRKRDALGVGAPWHLAKSRPLSSLCTLARGLFLLLFAIYNSLAPGWSLFQPSLVPLGSLDKGKIIFSQLATYSRCFAKFLVWAYRTPKRPIALVRFTRVYNRLFWPCRVPGLPYWSIPFLRRWLWPSNNHGRRISTEEESTRFAILGISVCLFFLPIFDKAVVGCNVQSPERLKTKLCPILTNMRWSNLECNGEYG